MSAKHKQVEYEVSNRIITIPNIISFLRLCLVPVFFVLLLDGHDLLATFVFALAACTDFIDGQIARRTNSVTKLGQLLDPAVDRCLMIFGVIGLLIIGRLPAWVVVFVLIRDAFLLVAGAILLQKYKKRIDVIYPGKVATTLLFVGFAGLLFNRPLIYGLGLCNISWLPGFNAALCSWGIWFVYAGLLLSFFVTLYYIRKGFKLREEAIQEQLAAQAAEQAANEQRALERQELQAFEDSLPFCQAESNVSGNLGTDDLGDNAATTQVKAENAH